jgi:hypothetical protein
VAAVVADQGSATPGFDNRAVLRHHLPASTVINGRTVTQVHSLYAHLGAVSSLAVGSHIAIGTQIGAVGRSGYVDLAHLRLEVTLGDVLPTSDDGCNLAGAPLSWVDPVAFVQGRLADAASPSDGAPHPVGAEFRFANPCPFFGNQEPAMAALPDGRFIAIYDFRPFGIYGQAFTASGAKSGAEFAVGSPGWLSRPYMTCAPSFLQLNGQSPG